MVRKMTTDVPLTVSDLRALAREGTASLPEGASLPSFETALLRVGLTASVTLLDRSAAAAAIDTAFAAGASSQQVQEIVSLVSGLGVHSLMMTAPMIIAAAARAGESAGGPLTVAQQDLWDRHVGEDPFWDSFGREMPGFLEAMLRLSPDQFTAFFDYCAVPWKSGAVRARNWSRWQSMRPRRTVSFPASGCTSPTPFRWVLAGWRSMRRSTWPKPPRRTVERVRR
jgi:hypothetical protein